LFQKAAYGCYSPKEILYFNDTLVTFVLLNYLQVRQIVQKQNRLSSRLSSVQNLPSSLTHQQETKTESRVKSRREQLPSHEPKGIVTQKNESVSRQKVLKEEVVFMGRSL